MSKFVLQSDGTSFIDLQSDGGDLLLQSDAGSADPFKQNLSLENPAPKKRLGGITELAVNLLVTALAVTAVNVPRDPFYVQQNKRPVPQQIQPVNLLQTTLAPVVAQSPFIPPVWENPRGRVWIGHQPIHTAPVYQAVVEPFIPIFWENVLRKKTAPIVFDSPNLLASTLAPVGQTPFRQLEWENPTKRGYHFRGYDLPQNQLPLDIPSVTVPPATVLITVWYNHGVEEVKYAGISFTPDTGIARKVE